MHLFATRILFVVATALVALSVGACTPYMKTPAHGLNSLLAMELSPDRPYNKEIGDRVESQLRNGEHLTVVGVISQTVIDGDSNRVIPGGRDPITVRTSMTRDSESHEHSFVTLVFDEDLVLIRGIFLKNGMIQEYLRQSNGDGVIVKRKSLHIHGTDTPFLVHETNCLIGVHIISWIGIPTGVGLQYQDLKRSDLDRAYKIRNRVVTGERLKDVLQKGRWCHVFSQRFPPQGEAVLEHVEYIDRESGFNRRWDTIQNGVWKKREYHVMSTEPVPGGLQLLWDTHVPTVKEK